MNLKPCPWCKGEVDMWFEEDPYFPGGPVIVGHYITCENCELKMSDENESKLIKRWNSLERRGSHEKM